MNMEQKKICFLQEIWLRQRGIKDRNKQISVHRNNMTVWEYIHSTVSTSYFPWSGWIENLKTRMLQAFHLTATYYSCHQFTLLYSIYIKVCYCNWCDLKYSTDWDCLIPSGCLFQSHGFLMMKIQQYKTVPAISLLQIITQIIFSILQYMNPIT